MRTGVAKMVWSFQNYVLDKVYKAFCREIFNLKGKKSSDNFKMKYDKNKFVIMESPFRGDMKNPTARDRSKNVEYAKACMRDCLARGEFPFASHLLYAQEGITDDNNAIERHVGIEAGLAWGQFAQITVVYLDNGVSSGMKHGIATAKKMKRKIIYRFLGGKWAQK